MVLNHAQYFLHFLVIKWQVWIWSEIIKLLLHLQAKFSFKFTYKLNQVPMGGTKDMVLAQLQPDTIPSLSHVGRHRP